jgi:hypothetical protein
MDELKTLKDFESELVSEKFNHESVNDKRKTFAYNLALQDLKLESIKQFKYLQKGYKNAPNKKFIIGQLVWIEEFFNLTEEDLNG